MRRKQKIEKVRPPVSDLNQQLAERRAKQFAPKLAKPNRVDRDKENYFRAEFYCPVCGTRLTSYTYGRAWTDNGLWDDKRVDCHHCGQMIDWTGVPSAEEE